MDLDAEVHSRLYENIMVSKASILIEELTLLFLLVQLTVLSPSACLKNPIYPISYCDTWWHHRSSLGPTEPDQVRQHTLSRSFQVGISIDNSFINSDQNLLPFKASSALALESISCMSGAIRCDQLWQDSVHDPCQINILSSQLWYGVGSELITCMQDSIIYDTPWSALGDRHT